ncbi:MAG: GNAT family N-acetyltransferase [Oscillospiraceae bacterium]|nr:GNAT family N-acetyltransferase [Oscillospiraceae bacterium]
MLEFRSVTVRDLARLRRYYSACNYQLCEYSAGTKLMWRGYLNPRYAEVAGCLVVLNTIGGTPSFDYPIPGPEGDVDAALAAMEDYCVDNGIVLTISVVPEEFGTKLAARYPRFCFARDRVWKDYIYAAEDLREFAGRRYSGQRNHINKFRKVCPGAAFRVLGKDDRALIDRFWEDYAAVFTKESKTAKNELSLAKKMLRLAGNKAFVVGGLEYEGRLISLSLAERCGDTLIVHIEKALYGYDGVYPATVQAFAQAFATDGVKWINREDDAGDKGLRMSKMQYLPDHLGAKLRFRMTSELETIDAVPTLKTERLVLDAITEADKDAYSALCMDDDRNRWWGYDYKKDWQGEDLRDYFYDVAVRDFANRLCINFAVRLDGKFIGEAVLYRFNYRGEAELGCRIDPAYAHHGYGTEAFAAVADWALYELALTRVVAKCYHENEASFRMLSSCMRRNGEDDTFYYFKKEV